MAKEKVTQLHKNFLYINFNIFKTDHERKSTFAKFFKIGLLGNFMSANISKLAIRRSLFLRNVNISQLGRTVKRSLKVCDCWTEKVSFTITISSLTQELVVG